MKETHALSLLDYGCGKGRQFNTESKVLHGKLGVYIDSWQEGLGVGVLTGYDPACGEWAKRPEGSFDGVYCCSVLEHLYEHDAPFVLRDIFQYAQKFVFIAVGTTPAQKNLPDGRNAHITVQPISWWEDMTRSIATEYPGIIWMISEEREKDVVVG